MINTSVNSFRPSCFAGVIFGSHAVSRCRLSVRILHLDRGFANSKSVRDEVEINNIFRSSKTKDQYSGSFSKAEET